MENSGHNEDSVDPELLNLLITIGQDDSDATFTTWVCPDNLIRSSIDIDSWNIVTTKVALFKPTKVKVNLKQSGRIFPQ